MYSLTCSWGQEPGAREARKEISKINFCLLVFFVVVVVVELASFI